MNQPVAALTWIPLRAIQATRSAATEYVPSLKVPVGWVERSETQRSTGYVASNDGFRCALPILREYLHSLSGVGVSSKRSAPRVAGPEAPAAVEATPGVAEGIPTRGDWASIRWLRSS